MGASSIQPGQSYSTGAAVQSAGSQFTGYQAASAGASYGSYAQYQSNQPAQSSSQSAQAITTSLPQIAGPYQESMAADDLKLSQPVADNFRPDESLGFVSATLPSDLTAGAGSTTYGSTTGSMTASSPWYYPGSMVSPNKFYVQTSYGLATVGGCRYGGYLPLWADISSGGNLFVYEWYPGQSTPHVRFWDWTWTGFKKGWFYGDVAGWHILCYNCRDWSNYVYIYVYPTNVYSSDSSGHANTGKAQTYCRPKPRLRPIPIPRAFRSLITACINHTLARRRRRSIPAIRFSQAILLSPVIQLSPAILLSPVIQSSQAIQFSQAIPLRSLWQRRLQEASRAAIHIRGAVPPARHRGALQLLTGILLRAISSLPNAFDLPVQ